MGGRTAMTLACRFPDRVEACISVDAGPVDESKTNILEFKNFNFNVVN
jgi:pimeloyl-ACP methyl ester carboxylesterase